MDQTHRALFLKKRTASGFCNGNHRAATGPLLTGRRLSPQKLGFTLVELLVTIVIIAILAALAISAFSKAQKNAERAVCLNNLRQIGVAEISYSNDNDNWITPNRTGAADGTYWWFNLLMPYLGQDLVNYSVTKVPSMPVFWCPSAKGPIPTYPMGYINEWSPMPMPRLSYVQNISLGGGMGWTPSYPPMCRRVQVTKPGKMVLVTEGAGPNCAAWSIEPAFYRHKGSINLLLLDGHVESSRSPISDMYGNTRYNWQIGSENN